LVLRLATVLDQAPLAEGFGLFRRLLIPGNRPGDKEVRVGPKTAWWLA